MSYKPTRRHFLGSAANVGVAISMGNWAGLSGISPANAQEAAVTPELVRYSAEIEPIVKLIADTPRDKCVEVMMGQLRKGLSYRHFLAALYLATFRAPTIHALHAALSVHASHQLSLELPAQESLLPVFWALDNFKERLNRYPYGANQKITLKGALPAAARAGDELRAGIEGADQERAERAILAMIRSQGAHEVIEPLWHYMVRHWGFIGHTAIYVSHAWRLLQTVGWEHAEPILCAAAGLIVMDGSASRQPDNSDTTSYIANTERIKKSIHKLPADWASSGSNVELTRELLGRIRSRESDEACDLAMTNLMEGKATAGAVWDAVLLGAGDCVVCDRGGNRPLHAITVAHAMRYAFEVSRLRENRLLLLLQGLNWMERYQMFDQRTITDLTPMEIPEQSEAAAEELLGTVRPTRHVAASKAFRFAQKFPDSDLLFRTAARLLPAKAGRDVHSVKFPMAMFENFRWISREWRPHMLAAASYTFLGAGAPDSRVIQQVREAMQ
ncbi:MAG: hypothetical protein ACT4PV_09440 [Planctomycetaceae bacterium]